MLAESLDLIYHDILEANNNITSLIAVIPAVAKSVKQELTSFLRGRLWVSRELVSLEV